MSPRLFTVSLLTIMGLVLASCASVPMASIDADRQAKQFKIPESMSRIYIYRNENIGGAVPMTVSLDGKTLGQTGPKTYFMVEVKPGEHTINSYTENVATLQLNAKVGHAHYVWQEVKMGLWTARSALQEVDEKEGQKAVLECKRARVQ